MLGVLPFAIEPDVAGMIAVDQLADLRDHELLVARVVALLVAEAALRDPSRRIVLAVPVHQRIVEVEL